MEYFVAAICDPNVGIIDPSKIDGIIQEFYSAGFLIQVGMSDGTDIKFSGFAAQNTVAGLLPFGSTLGSPFIGVIIRDPANLPNEDWYIEYMRNEPSLFDASDPYQAYPCKVNIQIRPSITTVTLKEAGIGMQYDIDPSIIQIEPPAFLGTIPQFYPNRQARDFVNFCEVNSDEVSGVTNEAPLYTEEVTDVTYICSENFTGSSVLVNKRAISFEY